MGVGSQPDAPAASTPWKEPVPTLQEAGWAPGPVGTGIQFRSNCIKISAKQTHGKLFSLGPFFLHAFFAQRT